MLRCVGPECLVYTIYSATIYPVLCKCSHRENCFLCSALLQLRLCPCSASAPALLSSGFSIVRYPCRQWNTFSSHTECIRIFMRLLKLLPPATCNLRGEGVAELIYSLQIKSGVENQLVCAIFCFYLYRVNTLCLSYADPLAT